jgi:hypothetical protein
LKAGQFADLNAMFSAVNEGAQLDKIDITKEADAKTLLAKYYQDVNKFDAKRAEGFVQVALEQGTLKDDAALALKHYKDENEKRQTTLAAEAEAKRRFAETSFNNLRQGVVAATKELNYSGEVLKGVQTMMAPVIDSANGNKQVYKEDGTPMLWYEVVMEDVRENPKHLTQLLAMLQSYDSKEGFKIVQNQQKAEQSVGNKEAFDMLTKLKKNHVSDSVGTADAKTFVPNPGQIYDI